MVWCGVVRCGAETDPHRIEIRLEIKLDGIQSKIPTIFRTSMKSAAREKEEEKRRNVWRDRSKKEENVRRGMVLGSVTR